MDEIILVGLDRDKTINADSGYFGKDDNWRDELKILDGVIEGIKKLNDNPKVKIVVCSNQAGVARGYFGRDRVDEINKALDEILKSEGAKVDGWYYCQYVGLDYANKKGIPYNEFVRETKFRKPKTGMLEKASNDLGLNWIKLMREKRVYFVGDKVSDVETGLNSNGKGILIFEDVEEGKKKVENLDLANVKVVRNFIEAVDFILSGIN